MSASTPPHTRTKEEEGQAEETRGERNIEMEAGAEGGMTKRDAGGGGGAYFV
jgi:hypothetical protein